MKKMIICVLILCVSIFNIFSSPEHTNFFDPYEAMFDSVRIGNFPDYSFRGVDLKIRYESSFHSYGYLSNDEDCLFNPIEKWRICKNSLQYLQDHENLLIACSGNSTDNVLGSFLQQYSLFGGATSNGLSVVTGNVRIDSMNIASEIWFTDSLRLGFYVPYYHLSLSNVRWNQNNDQFMFEQFIENDILSVIEKEADFNVNSYSVSGLGDSSLLLSWQDNFIEQRDFISGITCALRAGLHLPTKSYKDTENGLLRIPLGMDAGLGIHVGGSVATDLGYYFTVGVSADCTTLFGKIKKRRIKTDLRQTDLVLLTKENCYINPGFKQNFNIYFDFHNRENTWNTTFFYQYMKQNESDLYLCTDLYINTIAESMQRLEKWSTHSLVMYLQKQWDMYECPLITGLFAKWGFNGERVIGFNTLGFTLEYMF
jgi:hypothetical protein